MLLRLWCNGWCIGGVCSKIISRCLGRLVDKVLCMCHNGFKGLQSEDASACGVNKISKCAFFIDIFSKVDHNIKWSQYLVSSPKSLV